MKRAAGGSHDPTKAGGADPESFSTGADTPGLPLPESIYAAHRSGVRMPTDSVTEGEFAPTPTTDSTPTTAGDLPTAPQEIVPGTATAPAPTQDAATAAAVIHPSYAKAAGENPEVAAALTLNETFNPVPSIDYTWVVKHAREQFAQADAAFKTADEKAASIMGYLGSGAGVFALGSIAGLAANQLNAWIALFGVPSFVFAGLSLAFAAVARRPFDSAYPPGTAGAVSRAQWHPTATDAEASLIGVWHLATVMVQHATDKKARWIMSATWMFVTAVGCLLLPISVAVAQKLTTSPPAQPQPIIIQLPADMKADPIPAAK